MSSRIRIISRHPGPWSTPPDIMVLERPKVDTLVEGWDVMRETLWVPHTPYFAKGERRDQVLLPEIMGATLVVQDERQVGTKGGYPIIELTSLGLARTKPWKIVTDADTQGQIGAEGVTRNIPTVTVYWFSSTLVDTKSAIPYPAVPPETFNWQAKGGTSGQENEEGWYLIGRTVEPLPIDTGRVSGAPWFDTNYPGGGTTSTAVNLAPRPALCMVTDRYAYDFVNDLPPNN
jgi:hypothetical protein